MTTTTNHPTGSLHFRYRQHCSEADASLHFIKLCFKMTCLLYRVQTCLALLSLRCAIDFSPFGRRPKGCQGKNKTFLLGGKGGAHVRSLKKRPFYRPSLLTLTIPKYRHQHACTHCISNILSGHDPDIRLRRLRYIRCDECHYFLHLLFSGTMSTIISSGEISSSLVMYPI